MADDRDTWLEQVGNIQLPVLGATKRRLTQALAHPATSHTDLGRIITADPGLSLRLFRGLAESGHGPREATVGNPTRIIGLLGQAGLTRLADSTPTLEERYRRPALDGLKACYARALHAAGFARLLATLRGRPQAEDDAATALLQGLGEMLLWTLEPGTLQALTRAAQRLEDLDFRALEQLGICPSELGETLARRWGLPAAVARAQRPHHSFDPDSQLVLLSANLAWSGLRDWQSAQTDELFQLAAELTRLAPDLIGAQLHREVANISRIAHDLGLPHAGDRLLLPPGGSSEPPPLFSGAAPRTAKTVKPGTPSPNTPTASRPAAPPPQKTHSSGTPPPASAAPSTPTPPPTAPTKAAPTNDRGPAAPTPGAAVRSPPRPAAGSSPLQERLSGLLNRIREEQALGRIMLALVNSDRSEIRARFILGGGKGSLAGFSVPARTRNLFSVLLARPHALWINPGNQVKYLPHIPEQVAAMVDMRGFFLTSLVIRDRPIGLLYADGGARVLDAQGFEAFKQASRDVARLFAPAKQ